MNKKYVFISFAVIALLFLIFLSVFLTNAKQINIPLIGFTKPKEYVFSIGIYKMTYNGRSFEISQYKNVNNPVVSSKDITDRNARFVADPFLFYENEIYYMFFEVLGPQNGDIGLAISHDGTNWEYKQIVLDEPFHLSYPLVFKYNEKFYMIPETINAGSVRLYEATQFPCDWKFVKNLIIGNFCDSTLFRHNGKWWMLTSLANNSTLYLFYSENLDGEWVPYSKNPIVKKNCKIGRSGGNIIEVDGKLIRVAQRDCLTYGKAIRFIEIDKLTLDAYREHQLQEITSFDIGIGQWNRDGIHQCSSIKISDKEWICAIDGKRHKEPGRFSMGRIDLPPCVSRILEKLVEYVYHHTN